MLSTAFPHLLTKACLGKTVIPLANGLGYNFLLSGPPTSPWRQNSWNCWSFLEHGTNRAAGSRETLSGSGAQTKSLFPQKSDIWSLVFVGTQNDPNTQFVVSTDFFGRVDPKLAALTPRSREFLGTLTSRYSSCCSVLQPKPGPVMGAELLLEL